MEQRAGRLGVGTAAAIGIVLVLSLPWVPAGVERGGAPGAVPAEGAAIGTACGSVNPFFATSRFAPAPPDATWGREPAVFAFQDTPENAVSAQRVLANQAQVGSVFGLAYDTARRQHGTGGSSASDLGRERPGGRTGHTAQPVGQRFGPGALV